MITGYQIFAMDMAMPSDKTTVDWSQLDHKP